MTCKASDYRVWTLTNPKKIRKKWGLIGDDVQGGTVFRVQCAFLNEK